MKTNIPQLWALALWVGLVPGTMAMADEQPFLTDVTPHLRPYAADRRFYPEVAQRKRVEGRASAVCRVSPNGDLNDCSVESEDPQGCKFGDALVGLMKSMRVPLNAKDGSPTPGRLYRMELTFRLPPDQVPNPNAHGCT